MEAVETTDVAVSRWRVKVKEWSETAKRFGLTTKIGLSSILLYIVLMNRSTLPGTWITLFLVWVPLFFMYRQFQRIDGLEKKVCIAGVVILVALMLMRDFAMGAKLDELRRIQKQLIGKMPDKIEAIPRER